jgi:hypothetical protein
MNQSTLFLILIFSTLVFSHSLRDRRKDNVAAIFNGLLQVNANATVNGSPYPDIFTDNVMYRVHGTVAAGDLVSAQEYLFGLTSSYFFGAYSAEYLLQNFIMEDDLASAKGILLYKFPNGTNVSNITIQGQYRFSDEPHNRSRIAEFELFAPDLELFWMAGGLNFYDRNVQLFIIQGICNVHDAYCTGPLQQYENNTECNRILQAKNFGSPNMMTGDNIPCRNLHSNLVKINPEHHCSHISENGGGKCRYWSNRELHAPLVHTEPRLIY